MKKMEFKPKHLNIKTGNSPVVMLHKKDANMLDVYSGDKVRLTACKQSVLAYVDVSFSNQIIKQGEIGLFVETTQKMGKITCDVKVTIEKKPRALSIIKKKLDGNRLTYKDYYTIMKDIVDDKVSHIGITYFIAAEHIHNLTLDETVNLTKAIIKTGDTLKIKKKIIVDKHCIGGVAGNRTTMIVVPILASAGLTIPKTSSRSITSAAGTADTVEVFCPVNLDIKKMKKIIQKTGACLAWGGSMNLAPADDKIIRVEHELGIDAEAQLIASILGKKKSVSSTHVLIDIPVGQGGKIKTTKQALLLKKRFLDVAKRLKLKLKVVLTDGSQPIGDGIGPALEAIDVLKVLQCKGGSSLLREKSLQLAGEIFHLVGKTKNVEQGYALAQKILDNGRAWKKFAQIIKAQGGREPSLKRIRVGNYHYDITASRSGTIKHIDNEAVNRFARIAGAPFYKEAGLFLFKHKGDKIKKGEILFRVYSDNKDRLLFAKQEYKKKDGIVIL